MINNEAKRLKSFSRRAFVLGVAQAALVSGLGLRLAWLQLAEGSKYKILAEKNRINTKMIAPSRGKIVDRFGVPLAVNNQNFRVLLVPEQVEDIEGALNKLSKIITIPDYKIKTVVEKAKKSPSFLPLEVTDGLSWDDVSKLEVNITDLAGMSIDEGEKRHYPFNDATGHVVGYVGSVSQTEMTDDPVLKMPGFKIGKTGIEKSFDPMLRGRAGDSQFEVNVRGREVRELNKNKSATGDRISLSIDAELQRYCQQRLSLYKSASAVIMDAHTGAIYALASYPGFDPNLFVGGISHGEYQELLHNPLHPFNNKAVTGQYPPGSTFKMITAMAALEGGFANASTRVKCEGRYEYGNDRFHCWKLRGHGSMNVVSALMQSCDTYFYELSIEVGIDNISKMAQKFGLGQKYDFDLPEERSGLMPTKAWKEKKYGKFWRPGETIVSSIGQGFLLATPLQLGVMTARLVNGGYAVKPWLAGYEGTKKLFPDKWPKIDVKDSNLRLMKRGMVDVVNDEDGTAYASRIEQPDMMMGGKTGTAQVTKINRAAYAQGIMNEDLEWKFRHHALFVGYAPVTNPRYVCSVVVEHGGGGSSVAAPLAKDLLFETQKRNPAKADIKLIQDNNGKAA